MIATHHRDILDTAERWLAEGHKVAIGTVVKTWGSAPRQAGSQIVIRDDATFAGSVSGGCIEGIVIEAALETMDTRTAKTLDFGVSNELAWESGLACGGQLQVFVEPVA
jgi:xanthine/CO dehydrogenase XdhC/CoxF family maturation factor